VRLAVSISPAQDTVGAPHASQRHLLPASSQYVSLSAPAAYVGRALLTAELVLATDDGDGRLALPTGGGAVLAHDSRDVHLLQCSPRGDTVNQGSGERGRWEGSATGESCCLQHTLVPKAAASGPAAGSTTPPIAHFVFDVKGPPPRCSYFFFVAVRAAGRVLRGAERSGARGGSSSERGGGGGGGEGNDGCGGGGGSEDVGAARLVYVHYHFEPWGPWWEAIKALPHVCTR